MREYQYLTLKTALFIKAMQASAKIGPDVSDEQFKGNLTIALSTASLKVKLYKNCIIPLISMWKDVKDTFKPYKTDHGVSRDLHFPVDGLMNLFQAVCGLTFIPFVLLSLLVTPFKKNKMAHAIEAKNTIIFIVATSFIALIRGITQIAFTPLVWLRMPLRGLITAIKGKPKFEDSKSLRELANKKLNKDKPLQDSINITLAMYHKLNKANKRGQTMAMMLSSKGSNFIIKYVSSVKTKLKKGELRQKLLTQEEEKAVFTKQDDIIVKGFNHYRSLFLDAIQERDQEIAAKSEPKIRNFL